MLEKENEIVLGAVGDISLGDHYLCCGFGVSSKSQLFGADYIFKRVKDSLQSCDLLFGNLESVLSSHNLKKYSLPSFQMRGLPESIQVLKDTGFNILSLANNHSMQHGIEPLLETAKMLDSNGIGFCGICYNGDKSGTFFSNINGTSICFLGYNARPRQYFLDEPIYVNFNLNKALGDLKYYREKADLLVVSIHWGDEYIQIPSLQQQSIAHGLIDNGADLILGHHPHVVQGVEVYKNGLIFYSLGNFVFDMPWYSPANQSFIAQIRFNKLQKSLSHKIIPVRIGSNYQPEPIPSSEGDNFIKEIRKLSDAILENRRRYEEAEYLTFYSEQLYSLASKEKKLSHQFWISNFYKYPPILLPQYVYEILERRFRFFRKGKGKQGVT